VRYLPQDRVTHDKYGLGTILSVEEGVAVTVDFGTHTRRVSTPCAKMIKLRNRERLPRLEVKTPRRPS